ncbi:MAG: hypothetical protein ACR2P8_15570 [Myxococcota bacterium]
MRGSGSSRDQLLRELEPGKEDAPPDLEIEVAPGLDFGDYQPRVYSAKQNLSFRADAFFRADPLAHQVGTWRGEGPCVARVSCPEPPRGLRRLQPDFTLMTYRVFWGLMHFVLARRQAAFLHAAVASVDGEGVAFAGTGGCGKTSLLFSLLEDPRHRYLAEDFAIVGCSGRTWSTRKCVSIYASDARIPLLADYLGRGLTARQRILWARRSRRGNPRIKALPTEVLGERVAPSAELSRVFYLIRTAQSSVQCEPVAPAVLAERATRAGLRELKSWLETLQMIAANDVIESVFPTPEQVADELRALYGEAFAAAQTVLVRVPRRCPPAALLEALRQDGRL